MKKDQMKKNVGTWVQLVPTPIRLDPHGLPLTATDDDWFVERLSDAGVVIKNPRTGHVTELGEDSVHHWHSNPDRTRGDTRYGFFVLNVQLYIQGNATRIRPTQPGVSLPVQPPEVITKTVDLNYPSHSGILGRLEADGYTLNWVRPERVAGLIDGKGWEEVIEVDRHGKLAKFRGPGGLVLIKSRQGPQRHP
jgi:hypothetical protein